MAGIVLLKAHLDKLVRTSCCLFSIYYSNLSFGGPKFLRNNFCTRKVLALSMR